jgi:hypothetical protein
MLFVTGLVLLAQKSSPFKASSEAATEALFH